MTNELEALTARRPEIILSRHSAKGVTPEQWAAVLAADELTRAVADESAAWTPPVCYEWVVAVERFLRAALDEHGIPLCSDRIYEHGYRRYAAVIEVAKKRN